MQVYLLAVGNGVGVAHGVVTDGVGVGLDLAVETGLPVALGIVVACCVALSVYNATGLCEQLHEQVAITQCVRDGLAVEVSVEVSCAAVRRRRPLLRLSSGLLFGDRRARCMRGAGQRLERGGSR